MEKNYFTIYQVAEMLGMHHKTIRKFITEKRLVASKVGKQWRVSGHDLSVFLENNEHRLEEQSFSKEKEIGFSTTDDNAEMLDRQVNVSTVVDISGIGIDEYNRISNMLLAVMNSQDIIMRKSTINMKHSKDEKRLRIMLWGSVKFIESMLGAISMLVEKNDL